MPDAASRHEPSTTRGLLQHYLGDLIYGANDGIITTFAVVSGVTGANLSARVILILGFANLLADGFSMGASNYLAIRSDEAAREAGGRESVEPFALRHGTATFLSFLVAGLVPLVAYLVTGPGRADPFPMAVTLTLLTLFAVGASRSFVTSGSWWRSGVEMLLVGGAAAVVAYAVGAFVAGQTG